MVPPTWRIVSLLLWRDGNTFLLDFVNVPMIAAPMGSASPLRVFVNQVIRVLIVPLLFVRNQTAPVMDIAKKDVVFVISAGV
jgi:hypothetical protein